MDPTDFWWSSDHRLRTAEIVYVAIIEYCCVLSCTPLYICALATNL